MAKICPTLETNSLVYSYYLLDRWRFLSSKSHAYTYKHSCYMRQIWAPKFPFLYLTHVTLLSPAQGWLRVGSGLLTFAQAKYHFRHAAPQHAGML